MAVTLQQIADDLQLSKATVSRSLRNDPFILPQTRAKVHATAVRLGYQGRPRDLRRERNGEAPKERPATTTHGTLGLLFPGASLNHQVQARHDLNFVQLMHGVMAEAERSGKLLMVQTILPSREGLLEENPSEVPPMIREGVCQALIVRGSLHPDDIAFLARHLPVVTIGRVYHESAVDAVVPDSVGGVRTLVNELVQLGHRRMVWVGANYMASFLEERQAGFVTGCLHNGLNLAEQRFLGPEIYVNRRIGAGEPLLQAIRDGATAMVCANDSIASEVIGALENSGLQVPDDVSVTGFDAVQLTESERQITSIDPHFIELGRAAVRLAAQRLNQSASPPYVTTVRSKFVPGNTIATPKQ